MCAHTQAHTHHTCYHGRRASMVAAWVRAHMVTHRTPPRCDTQPAACATEMLYAHEFYWDRHKARSSTLGAPTPPTPPPPSLPPPALPPEPPLSHSHLAIACCRRLQVPSVAAGRGLAYRRAAALARRHTHARGPAHAAPATSQQDGVVPWRLDHHADVRGRLLLTHERRRHPATSLLHGACARASPSDAAVR